MSFQFRAGIIDGSVLPPLGFCSGPGVLLAVHLVLTGLLPGSIRFLFFKVLSQRSAWISEYYLLRKAHGLCLSQSNMKNIGWLPFSILWQKLIGFSLGGYRVDVIWSRQDWPSFKTCETVAHIICLPKINYVRAYDLPVVRWNMFVVLKLFLQGDEPVQKGLWIWIINKGCFLKCQLQPFLESDLKLFPCSTYLG